MRTGRHLLVRCRDSGDWWWHVDATRCPEYVDMIITIIILLLLLLLYPVVVTAVRGAGNGAAAEGVCVRRTSVWTRLQQAVAVVVSFNNFARVVSVGDIYRSGDRFAAVRSFAPPLPSPHRADIPVRASESTWAARPSVASIDLERDQVRAIVILLLLLLLSYDWIGTASHNCCRKTMTTVMAICTSAVSYNPENTKNLTTTAVGRINVSGGQRFHNPFIGSRPTRSWRYQVNYNDVRVPSSSVVPARLFVDPTPH